MTRRNDQEVRKKAEKRTLPLVSKISILKQFV
jgi:hypothetical protein